MRRDSDVCVRVLCVCVCVCVHICVCEIAIESSLATHILASKLPVELDALPEKLLLLLHESWESLENSWLFIRLPMEGRSLPQQDGKFISHDNHVHAAVSELIIIYYFFCFPIRNRQHGVGK